MNIALGHLEKIGEKLSLLCQVSSVGRGYSCNEEEVDAIEHFMEALEARLSIIKSSDRD